MVVLIQFEILHGAITFQERTQSQIRGEILDQSSAEAENARQIVEIESKDVDGDETTKAPTDNGQSES